VTPAANATSAILATIHLKGQTPAGAKEFTWRYGWTFATYSFTRQHSGGPAQTDWLEGSDVSKPFPLSATAAGESRLVTAWRYVVLGFTHILPFGLDHLLFILGLYLLNSRLSAVLWQASAFTLAHSLTLGLSLYGVVEVSPAIVEPLIALSIAYIAVENILRTELKKWRIALIFGFGLLHGLGFAGALREVGMPPGDFALALVTFNLGVEAGQFAVILAAFALVGWRFADRVWYRARIAVPASAAIACMAVYWTLERTIL
jgi:hydrogenase/urease accessory protein HupE